jgi:hypothetical protein
MDRSGFLYPGVTRAIGDRLSAFCRTEVAALPQNKVVDCLADSRWLRSDSPKTPFLTSQ